jgi:hypothetical protein
MADWKILSLKSKKEDGCIIEISYQCTISDPNGGGSARKIGQISISGTTDVEGFIPYDNVTESDALSWLYNALGDEKQNIEDEVALKVIERAQRRAARQYTNGTPW